MRRGLVTLNALTLPLLMRSGPTTKGSAELCLPSPFGYPRCKHERLGFARSQNVSLNKRYSRDGPLSPRAARRPRPITSCGSAIVREVWRCSTKLINTLIKRRLRTATIDRRAAVVLLRPTIRHSTFGFSPKPTVLCTQHLQKNKVMQPSQRPRCAERRGVDSHSQRCACC